MNYSYSSQQQMITNYSLPLKSFFNVVSTTLTYSSMPVLGNVKVNACLKGEWY